MVTMTINFNQEKLKERGLTVEYLLKPFESFCQEFAISRPQIHVFEKEGEHGFALVGKIMRQIIKNEDYLILVDSWYWDVDGEREDLLETAYKWRNRK